MKRVLSILLVALSVASCQTAPPSQTLPEITFSHLAPLTFAAGRMRLHEAFRPKMAAPYVDHLFPTPPVAAMKRWAEDRLVPGGGPAVIDVTILDASVREVELEKIGGIRGALTNEQSERYEARVEAIVQVSGPGGSGRAQASAVRTRTVPEDATLAERERIRFDMTEALMRDFNVEMEKEIRAHLAAWLR